MPCKLYLVPEDVILSWRAEQRQDLADRPVDTAASRADTNMSAILNQTDTSAYEKEKMYSQELGKYLTFRENRRPTASTAATSSSTLPAPRPQQLTSIPKMYANKAKALLEYLEADKDVSWDERGEVSIGQQKLDGSHIVDLIHDALRYRRQAERPAGWRDLSAYLKQRNVPKELVGNSAWYDDPPKKKKTTSSWTRQVRKTNVRSRDGEWSTPPQSPIKGSHPYAYPTPMKKKQFRQTKAIGLQKIKAWQKV